MYFNSLALTWSVEYQLRYNRVYYHHQLSSTCIV